METTQNWPNGLCHRAVVKLIARAISAVPAVLNSFRRVWMWLEAVSVLRLE
ncbi:hypothetical protein NST38_30595 [Paenibacillus sp. FSL H8-0104]|uniref:hypothetical protein n=1 Tax=Paenibacillus sp. FSL H8-0104 TaxID=2954509 RepID=UPI0030FD2E22